MRQHHFPLIYTNLPSPFICVSYISTRLLPRFLCPHLFSALPPSLPLSPSVFTRLCLLPLPVAPVYEGKFIGLPGAVSWRWPPQLKPQQGFALHTEQKQHSGHTGLFPSAHIYTCWYTHTSHYLLMSIPVFFLLPLLNPASLHRVLDDWLGGCCCCCCWGVFSYFILLHLAFVFYWSTRSS